MQTKAEKSGNQEVFSSVVITVSARGPPAQNEGSAAMWPLRTVEPTNLGPPSRPGSCTKDKLVEVE